MMIISLIGKLCSEWNWKITEKYCKILKIQKILKSGENNDDDITGRKAMQADGIGRANTQFDGQCNFLCSPPISIGYNHQQQHHQNGPKKIFIAYKSNVKWSNVHKYHVLLLPNRENLSFQAARVKRQVKRNKLNFPVFDVKRTLPEERLPEFSLFLDLIHSGFISKHFRISFRQIDIIAH